MLVGFSDVVANTGAVGSWHTGPLAHDANQLAAMPSLHMAWAAWCAVVIWQLSPRVWVRALAVLYPCVTCLAVLGTGNHFVLDILAGLATAALALALASVWSGAPARTFSAAGAAGDYPLDAGS
jgi:hypothetical protein